MSEEWEEDCSGEEDEGLYCDYDVCEFCEDPQTKSLGLCTTECNAYLSSCKRQEEEMEK